MILRKNRGLWTVYHLRGLRPSFSWTCPGICLLTVVTAASSSLLFFTYPFKTILVGLFTTFGLSRSSKPSFLDDHITIHYIRIFPPFSDFFNSKISIAESFCSKRGCLSWYSQKTTKEFEQFGLQNAKNIYVAGKYILRARVPKVFKSKDMVRQVWNIK